MPTLGKRGRSVRGAAAQVLLVGRSAGCGVYERRNKAGRLGAAAEGWLSAESMARLRQRSQMMRCKG